MGMTDTAEILEKRLIDGERKIAAAEARGEDTARLVDFWIDLLHQYERAVDGVVHEQASMPDMRQADAFR